MHSLDRHLRLVRWLALAVLIGPEFCALAGGVLASALYYGWNAITLDQVMSPITWSNAWTFAFFALFAWTLFTLTHGAPRRERLRERALHGDADAMAPSLIAARSEDATDVASAPLSLLWRRSRRPSGIIASHEGLRWQRPHRHDVMIPWSEARLLEVWSFYLSGTRLAGYCLYDRGDAYIEWQEYTGDRMPPSADGASSDVMHERQRQLLAIVITRSGLTPRTLAAEFMARDQVHESTLEGRSASQRPGMRQLSLSGMLFVLGLGTIPLAAGLLAVILPLTHTPWLNLYAAATLGVLGLVVLAFIALVLRSVVSEQPSGPPPFVALPPAPPSDTDSLTLREPGGWRGKLVAVALGLVCISEVYPAFRAMLDHPMSSTPLSLEGRLQSFTTVVLLVVAIIGSLIAGMALFERRAEITADQDGLRWRRGKRRIALPWEDIARLVAYASGGKVTRYGVVGSGANRIELTWSGASLRNSNDGSLPPADAASVLAATVARRTGLTLAIVAEE